MIVQEKNKRHNLDILKVKLWYEEIRYQKGFISTYQMEQYFDPLPNTGVGTRFRSKWANYKYGRHTPNTKVIDSVDLEVPEAKKIIHSPLWALLKAPALADSHIQKYLFQLSPEILESLEKNLCRHGSYVFKNPSSQSLRKLLLLANFDLLAMLYILWLIETVEMHRAKYVDYMYQIFLIIGAEYHERELFELIIPLFELFEERVFSKTKWIFSQKYIGNSNIYDEHVRMLRIIGFQSESFKGKNSISKKKKMMVSILNNEVGYNWQLRVLIV